MAKEKNKNTTKSFIMLMVTGVVLVAVTLCWFALSNKSQVDQVQSNIENDASSIANIYYGVDVNNEIAITKDTLSRYEKFGDTKITLSNMIPGAEYFYKAEFKGCKNGQTITLSFDGITGNTGLASQIMVYRVITTTAETIQNPHDFDNVISGTLSSSGLKQEFELTGDGNYTVYYSLKFKDEATVSYAAQELEIKNVSVVISD